ncbi:tachykinin-like peptides receptor 86C [Physella acuta]|uniref:tachykinin-like peptides receptor 86C n=1 Tax=Physella acuta TaxID=109671 RepID=UPI0027DD08B7|nr:tachykinin-like peptides receptor 86C [Physella acuta]
MSSSNVCNISQCNDKQTGETLPEISGQPLASDLISDEQAYVITFITYGVIAGVISVVGVALNVVNIVVFIKMGFTDTTNITLLSLSAADLGVLLMLVGFGVIYNPLFVRAVHGLESVGALDYLPIGWPFVCFSRISGCLTAFLTLERFVCVAFPLKVKRLITQRRTLVVNIFIYSLTIACTVPVFFGFQIEVSLDPNLNQTILRLVTSDQSSQLENVSLTFNFIVHLTSFSVVTVFTVCLSQKFLQISEWRQTASVKSSSTASRDKRLVKLIILIAAIFIVCSLPGVVGIVVMLVVKDYNVTGLYRNTFIASYAIFFALGSINSTVNIFIYLNMSSKFKLTFMSLFRSTFSQKLLY